jgi:membrane protease YdiL (CAAX protease family)
MLRRYPLGSYFVGTFAISWIGAFVVVASKLIHGQEIPKLSGLLMFPAMLLGPSVAGAGLTAIVDGRNGLRDLGLRMRRVHVSPRYYATLLVPPTLVLTVLYGLTQFFSPVFAHGAFVIGIAFGLLAGFTEEIGWTGFAFPRMRSTYGPLGGSILLGLVWGVWHLPVIDYLGAATPHGTYWMPFVLAFIAAVTAVRVLIGWAYEGTDSVFLAQVLHASSTSSLAIFGPPGVSAAQETLWYAVYAGALWIAIAVACVIRPRE